MKNKILSIAAVVMLALLTSVWAADIDGKWIAMTPGRQGTVETVFSLRADGNKLTGTVANSQGETAISDGKINGDDISFVVIRSVGGNEMKFVYKGRVAEDEIKFMREIQGGMREGQSQAFIAKREFQRNGDVPILKEQLPRR